MGEKIDYLKIGNGLGGEFGWVYTKSSNLYYLWWSEVYPDEMSAIHQVRYSHWVAMLREAIRNNLDVEFITETSSSSKVVTVKLLSS